MYTIPLYHNQKNIRTKNTNIYHDRRCMYVCNVLCVQKLIFTIHRHSNRLEFARAHNYYSIYTPLYYHTLYITLHYIILVATTHQDVPAGEEVLAPARGHGTPHLSAGHSLPADGEAHEVGASGRHCIFGCDAHKVHVTL